MMLVRLSSGLIGFAPLAAKLGADPVELCNRVGLPPSCLDDANQFISCEAFYSLLELAATETGCAHLGLHLGSDINLSAMGPTGFVIQHASTPMEALKDLRRYNHLHDQGTKVELLIEGQTAFLTAENLVAPDDAFHVIDRAAGLGLAILRMIGGRHWRPLKVLFRHHEPEDSEPYQTLFGCPVLFGQEVNALAFEARILNAPISQESNTHTTQVIREYIRRLEQQTPCDLTGQVKMLIQQLLSTNNCQLATIAEMLQVSQRSLQRHLSNNGTSFSNLVEETRIEKAQKYLLESNISMSQLADLLGYTEPSNFSRAFKRRVGLAPLVWQKSRIKSLP